MKMGDGSMTGDIAIYRWTKYSALSSLSIHLNQITDADIVHIISMSPLLGNLEDKQNAGSPTAAASPAN